MGSWPVGVGPSGGRERERGVPVAAWPVGAGFRVEMRRRPHPHGTTAYGRLGTLGWWLDREAVVACGGAEGAAGGSGRWRGGRLGLGAVPVAYWCGGRRGGLLPRVRGLVLVVGWAAINTMN